MLIQSIIVTLLLVTWQQEFGLVASEIHFKKGAPHVKLANGGLLSGIVKFSRDGRPFNAFIGLPYATVPGRFEESQPITEPSWQGVLSATKPGPMCLQMPFIFSGRDQQGGFGEENCLNLNVYVPMNNTGTGKKGYPVMVWIHGGAFMFGSGFGYSPQFFLDEDILLVTLNYRVGAFGFLSTGDNVIRGNNGMKDVVLALKWVQENIKAFGGNPSKVTIFGESAGAAAVHHLLLSPTTKGLFHRAISLSGSALSQWAFDPNPKQRAVELATYLECPTTASEPSGISSEEILSCLKETPADQLNKAQVYFKGSWPLNMRSLFFAPSLEPIDPISNLTPFQSEPPVSILTSTDRPLPEIPWMIGATEDEGAPMYADVVISKPELLKELNSDWENIAPSIFDYGRYLGIEEQRQVSKKLKEFYFGDQEISEESRDALANIYSDEMILHGVYRSAVDTASRGKRNPVYLYQYAYKGPMSLMGMSFQIKGYKADKVGHGDDLQHLFNFGAMIPGQEMIKADTPDEEFSKNFVRLLASFAIHGEPKHTWGNATFREWKCISKRQQVGLDALRWFRIESNPVSNEVHHSFMSRMQLWDNIWKDYLTPAFMANYNPPTTTEEPQTDGKKDKTEL